ncbi:hypothetical protein DUI87_09720 [Hirundo rustica rustica]|uniref:Integrase catalytic domain-containing protein n=1 Tax=Hirundo rustica rustica TaxID=333673 RepID=A0A3M0KG47_HIRRU|nr:hypothetical protein DUI87_09720 [Hirundo rustica rustica]
MPPYKLRPETWRGSKLPQVGRLSVPGVPNASYKLTSGTLAGVNPRGLKSLQIWQTDVTQTAKFGRLKYVHVSVDTFSSAMWASAHTREKSCEVIAHQRQAFAVLGTSYTVKTDNGPAYTSQKILEYAGHLQGVFVLTCNRKGRIWPTGNLQTMTGPKVIKWMNLRVMTQMEKMRVTQITCSKGVLPLPSCHKLEP